MEKEYFSDYFFTQKCNNFTYLYDFVHNDIYYLLHTSIIRQYLERTGEINEDQRISKKTIGNTNDFKLCN